MRDLHNLREQGYIDDIPLEYAYEFTNTQLKQFLDTGIAYQQTLAIRLLNKRIGYQLAYQDQLKQLLKEDLGDYTRKEIESILKKEDV